MSKLINQIRSTATALTLLAAANSARAGIVGSDVINANGTVTYSYTVNNSGGAFAVSAWSLEFAFLVPDWNQFDVFTGGDVHVPNANWFADAGTPITGKSAQDFISLDPSSDVATGQKLYGFSFTSRYQPGNVQFEEFSDAGASSSGTTIGPVYRAVPEGNGPLEVIAFAALAGFGIVTRASREKNTLCANR